MFYVDDNDDNRGWYREDRKGKGKKGGFKGKGKGKGLPQPSAPFERKDFVGLDMVHIPLSHLHFM